MLRKLTSSLAVLALAGVASAAPSGIDITPVFNGNAFDLSGTPVTASPNTAQPATYIYEFDLFVSIDGLSTSEDLLQLGFVTNYAGGASNAQLQPILGFNGDYTPNNPLIDPPNFGGIGNNAPSDTTFFLNFRQSNAIGVSIRTGSTANLYGDYATTEQFGEAGGVNALGEPSKIGSLFVVWDGATAGTLSFGPGNGSWLGILTGNTNGAATSAANIQFFNTTPLTGEFQFIVPEPASVALLALGGLLVGVRRRGRA